VMVLVHIMLGHHHHHHHHRINHHQHHHRLSGGTTTQQSFISSRCRCSTNEPCSSASQRTHVDRTFHQHRGDGVAAWSGADACAKYAKQKRALWNRVESTITTRALSVMNMSNLQRRHIIRDSVTKRFTDLDNMTTHIHLVV
jgi:hypothetical protein